MEEKLSRIDAILAKVQSVLSGEPLRAIGYGGGVIIFIVAKAVGAIPDVSLDQALLQATGAAALVASLVETARRFVYSPKTVERIENTIQNPPVETDAAGVVEEEPAPAPVVPASADDTV